MLIKPRLNDYHWLPFTQNEVDFAIPFLDEDIPLYLDPFLLYKSPSQQDNSLHWLIINSFNSFWKKYLEDPDDAINLLIEISECSEVWLWNSKSKEGKKMWRKLAESILNNFQTISWISKNWFLHLEELQLLVENFSKDRVSDISCNLLKSFLIDYTIQQSEKYWIPTSLVEIEYFDNKKFKIIKDKINLPINPTYWTPILFIPKRWLRFIPWINFEDYFKDYVKLSSKIESWFTIPRVEILEFNRANYDQVCHFIQRKILEQKDCRNDPLFSQIPILSSKRKIKDILKLPTGKTDNADKDYENILCPLLSSMLYPELDFAQPQSRTESWILIRDLIFYNNISESFLKTIYEEYSSKQIVFELKNVEKLDTTHINQLNRYLKDGFWRFWIIFTRNPPPKNVYKNTIDLWAWQRKCILILTDEDLKLMGQVYENKQRKPLDVINKKFVEFMRDCPS